MNKVFKQTVVAAVIILTSSVFINCDNKATIKKNEVVTLALEDNLDHTVKEKITTRKPVVFITGYDKGNE
ncbi:MAG: hypothetical protein ACI8RP_001524, partial [Urechidicola sp.]